MNDSKAPIGRRIRSVIVVLFMVAMAIVVVLPIVMCAGIAMFAFSDPVSSRDVTDPGGDFAHYTSLAWPENAKILSVADNHGGFHGDGEFHVVFEADGETLAKWLAQRPPWDQSEWKVGPVPTDIGIHCAFGSSGVASASINGGPNEYSGDPKLERVLGSNDIRYAAKERCCESLRWHNGNLLILDLANNRVWLSIWDF